MVFVLWDRVELVFGLSDRFQRLHIPTSTACIGVDRRSRGGTPSARLTLGQVVESASRGEQESLLGSKHVSV